MKDWTLKNKDRLLALFVVLVVVVFTYSVVDIYKDNNRKHIEELQIINSNAITATRQAQIESDSAKIRAIELNRKVSVLESSLSQQNIILSKFQTSYDKSLYQLNKIKYEKDYVPDNVSTDEQSNYISNYKYEPY